MHGYGYSPPPGAGPPRQAGDAAAVAGRRRVGRGQKVAGWIVALAAVFGLGPLLLVLLVQVVHGWWPLVPTMSWTTALMLVVFWFAIGVANRFVSAVFSVLIGRKRLSDLSN